MSETKCYRHGKGPDGVEVNIPSLLCIRNVGDRWFYVWKSGAVEFVGVAVGKLYDHSLQTGWLIEVPDPLWPIIDGVPKNPAAFEALYKTCLQALDNIESDVHISPQLLRLRESVKSALALADKGVVP